MSYFTTNVDQPVSGYEADRFPLRMIPQPPLARPFDRMLLEPLPPTPTKRPSPRIRWRAWLLTAALSVMAYFLISRYVVTTAIVQGRSMAPTLADGERVLLSRVTFLWRAPHRGELVVLRDPGHDDFAVKRVIAGPFDSLHFRNGSVWLNGVTLPEPYLEPGIRTETLDLRERWVELGPDSYYVLGDNRANSEDSRTYGPVHRSRIVGMVYR